jgi:hypothetical protein
MPRVRIHQLIVLEGVYGSVRDRAFVIRHKQQPVHDSGARLWSIIVKSTQPATDDFCNGKLWSCSPEQSVDGEFLRCDRYVLDHSEAP